jgi:hypothetical protein
VFSPWTPWPVLAAGLTLIVTAVLVVRHRAGRGWHGFGITIAAGLTLVLAGNGALTAYVQVSTTQAVQVVSGRDDVRMQCAGPILGGQLTMYGEAGWVVFDGGEPREVAYVISGECKVLRNWLWHRPEVPTADDAYAVHILVHEGIHLAGERNEAYTDCLATQATPAAVVALGGTEEQGRALAARYFHEVYPLMRVEYRSKDCVPGGAWDNIRGPLPGPTGEPQRMRVAAYLAGMTACDGAEAAGCSPVRSSGARRGQNHSSSGVSTSPTSRLSSSVNSDPWAVARPA